jgi:hypothetical protein
MAAVARFLIPVVLLAASAFGAILPGPPPQIAILAETQTDDGKTQVEGKVNDLDFTALIERVTNQPNAGRIVKIEIVDGNRKVIAEYQRDTKPKERAADIPSAGLLQKLRSFLDRVNRK